MSFARMHKAVSYLCAGLGFWAIAIGPYLSGAAIGLIAIAFVASVFVEGERIRDPRWNRGWTIAVIAFLVVQVARGLLGGSIIALALEFTAAIQVSRLFNRRGAAEYQQITALSLMMLIAATVLTTELTYAFAFAGFVVVVPWMLALGHLRAEIEASHRDGDEPDREAVAKVLASERLIGPRFLAGTALLSIPLFLMTGLLFVAFPRVGLGMFSFGQGGGQQVTGFGANVELGDFGVIRTDPTVVVRVVPPELPEDPPDQAVIRLRGTSFDHYDGRRWTRSRELLPETIGRHGTHYTIPLRMPTIHDAEWEIVLDPLEEPVIFLPPNTVGLRIPPRVVGSMDVGRDISLAPGIDIRYGDADGTGLRYTAYTSPDAVYDPELEPDMARRYLQVPEGHERVAALAREWTEGATSDRERVARILARLRDSGEYAYSLDLPPVGERLPLDVFLLEARRGHCEYYATALAVMLRTLGIPTRNATGFLGGRWNAYGAYYALSQGDAHSWVEAWLPERGWVTVDPTPHARGAIGPDPGVFGWLIEMMDAVRTRWANDVVSFDLRSQARIFWYVRRWMRGEPTDVEDAARARAGAERTGESIQPRWPKVIGAIGALIVLVLIWRLLRRLPRRRRREDGDAARAVALFEALDRQLARLGWARPPDRTATEHAEHLARAGFPEADLVRRVVDRYLLVRYGGGTLDPAELRRERRAIRSLAGRRDLLAPSA